MDVEQRARELLAKEYESAGHTTRAQCIRDPNGYIEKLDKCNLRAITAALTPPDGSDQNLLELAATFETCIPFLPSAGQRNIGKAVAQLRHMAMGYVLVPVEPTGEMLDAGRAAVMAEHCAGPKWTPRQHFEASGRSTAGIPDDVLDERGPLTKESTAAMVFGIMLAARPEVPDERR